MGVCVFMCVFVSVYVSVYKLVCVKVLCVSV